MVRPVVVEAHKPTFNPKQRYAIFKDEIELIQDEDIKKFVIAALNKFDDYYFYGPSSSTGLYHPKYALGVGGLVRHVKATVKIAKSLLDLDHNIKTYNQTERDSMIAALILHDGCKPDKNHAELCVKIIVAMPEFELLTDFQKRIITTCIRNHMGQWEDEGSHILCDRRTCDAFVHECDYLASRKFINIDTGYEGKRVLS